MYQDGVGAGSAAGGIDNDMSLTVNVSMLWLTPFPLSSSLWSSSSYQ